MEKIKTELHVLKKNNVFAGRSIVAIGRIEHIRMIQGMLNVYDLKLEAIVDNDKKKQGNCVNGILVHLPEDVLLPFSDNRIILVYSPKYWEEIVIQFEKMGYVEGKHIIVLQKPTLRDNIRKVWNGYRLYKRFQNEFGKHVSVFVCSCPMGDFYLMSLYFRQYLEYNNITEYVIVGNSKGLIKLSEIFGFENVKYSDTEQIDSFIKLYIFMGHTLRLKILSIWQGAFRFNPCIVRQKESFTFMDTFKHYIYALPESVRPAIPQFDSLSNDLLHSFEEKGLIRGKTVILAPYSYSMQSLPISFWKNLSERLKDNGYCVAVNIDEKVEKNLIEGTETMDISLRESVCALEYAGAIIGIRSGFFDVTSSADCKRVVLYPKKIEDVSSYSWNCTDMDFNSLNAMGLCNDAIEMEFPIYSEAGRPYIENGVYDKTQSDHLIDFIMKNF